MQAGGGAGGATMTSPWQVTDPTQVTTPLGGVVRLSGCSQVAGKREEGVVASSALVPLMTCHRLAVDIEAGGAPMPWELSSSGS